MITIKTTIKHQKQVQNCINSVERLNELISISTDNSINPTDKLIEIENNRIISSLDWKDMAPPYVFEELEFSVNNLLAIIFYNLGNPQKTFEFASEDSVLYQNLFIATSLQFGYEISKEQIEFLKKSSTHNLAIVYHFGNINPPVSEEMLQKAYREAIKNAKTDSLMLFAAKQYATFLLDNSLYEEAEKLIYAVQKKASTQEEQNAMNHLLACLLMAQIKLPYQAEILEKIATLQVKTITYYESQNLKINAGLVLIEASEIANYQKEFIKSKDFINKAILYFREGNIPEFLAEATFQKATLLYSWSKNGSPQYYKPAINAFQNALKIFKRDTYPQKFADIHHHLGLIYSEIKVSDQEKPIWTAFCASSFKEALQFYTKEEFPYQHAMVSHNYATALMGFPEAKLHNNLDKAFGLFEEALAIRTSQKYPFERALTLLNQLELYWLMNNKNKEEEAKNYENMLKKANQVAQLVSDADLRDKAKEHLKELKNLKIIIE